MNKNAEQHLAKAKEYVDRGEQFYHMAAEQILAANNEGATWVEIGDALGHSDEWAKRVASWHETPANDNKGTLPFSEEQGVVAKRHARSVLRGTPEQVAEILEDPEIRRNLAKAQDLRHAEQKQRSDKAYREAIGEDTADALDKQQALTDAEAELFKSRRSLRDAIAILRTLDLTEVRESWLEDLIKTIDDIAAMLQLGRSLVDGDSVDEAIDRILEGSK